MQNQMFFSVLGGGQSIGANSYYLEFGKNNVLLDCGKGCCNGLTFGPDFTSLMNRGILPQEVQNVFISHAHFDHIGYLPDIFNICGNVPAFSSTLTARLGHVLLWDNYYDSGFKMSDFQMKQYMHSIEKAFASLNCVEYARPTDFGDYKATFYEAGHIPGAAMIYMETQLGSVLYTGDFSLEKTSLTNGAMLPDGLKADVVIIDGTNAKRPWHKARSLMENSFAELNAARLHPICIRVNHLSRGIETLNQILALMESGAIKKSKIFIDDALWNIAEAFMNEGIQVLNDNCYRISDSTSAYLPDGIYISGSMIRGIYDEITLAYSLHADFSDLKNFLNRHAREKVIIVHSPTLERDTKFFYSLAEECAPKLSFCYPQQGETYQIIF